MYENFNNAESYDPGGAVLGTFGWFVIFAIYFYFAFMHYKMAQKSSQCDSAWWAFVPILNTVLLIKMAEKPMHWFLFLFIPVVNIFCFFSLWMNAAKKIGQSPVWGFLALIPFINFVAMFVLAFGSTQTYSSPSSSPMTGPPSKPRDKAGVS